MNVSNIWLRSCLTVKLGGAVLLSAQTLQAQNATGQINLISTIGGNPSLSPLVTWKVFRLSPRNKDAPTNVPLYTLNRHSISLNLTPGHYKAVVSLADTVREHEFKVQAEDKHTIEVPIDNTPMANKKP
ncbi:MAG: hypothetical protein RLZZ422_476 [Pseudomonadota bacterium]|jgi:hypothetical protein